MLLTTTFRSAVTWLMSPSTVVFSESLLELPLASASVSATRGGGPEAVVGPFDRHVDGAFSSFRSRPSADPLNSRGAEEG
jgi:hypothetical protein